jgi:hypothetical protein
MSDVYTWNPGKYPKMESFIVDALELGSISINRYISGNYDSGYPSRPVPHNLKGVSCVICQLVGDGNFYI